MQKLSKKQQERKTRALKMARALKKLYPLHKKSPLNGKNVWELLISVILSAQCTDERVNQVTKKLFKKYRKLDDYIKVRPNVFEKDIYQTGFYKNKTKNILGAAKKIKKDFNGEVPNTMKDLLIIPGVARKTANIILIDGFGKVEGLAVDTHVRRFSIKFDLSDSKDPKKIEQDLMELLPKKDWPFFSHRLVQYGKDTCPAGRHDCGGHSLTKVFSKAADIWPKAK